MRDWDKQNRAVIDEFRANQGRVGGVFEGAPMIIIHTTGAKSGLERVNPLMYLADDSRYVLIASKAGASTHPDWYYNIVANPEFEVEVGVEQFVVIAVVADEPERTELYGRMAALYPTFADYEKKANRIIPVVILTRKS